MARDRRAALGDGDRRRLHRRRDHGHAPRRRDAVRGLHLLRVGPPRHGRGQAALARRHAGADHGAAPLGRRLLRRPVPLAEPGELVRAHPGPEGGLPRDAGGREGPARRPRSRTRTRCSTSSTSTSTGGSRPRCPTSATRRRSARRASHREGDDVSVDHLGRDGAHRRRGGAAARGRRRLGRDPRPAHADPLGQAGRAGVGTKTSKVLVLHEDTHTGGFGGEIAATIAEEAFEDLDAPLKRIAAPDTPVPFSPPLEKALHPAGRGRRRRDSKELAEY